MTAILPISVPSTIHTAFGGAPDILTGIYRDEVNLAVWRRHACPAVAEESRRLLEDRAFSGYQLTLPSARLAAFDQFLPGLAVYPRLRADIHLLAEMFSCLFDLKCVGMRLTALTRAMCPKFHVDRVTCRLICTYTGTGTEWLPNDAVDRGKLGAYPLPHSIQKLEAGHVALLKGESWEGNEGAGAVHRSPSVENGEQRLLLTLDAQ
jgi:hypothetical protein